MNRLSSLFLLLAVSPLACGGSVSASDSDTDASPDVHVDTSLDVDSGSPDAPSVDSGKIDSTVVDSTVVDSTVVDSTAVDSTVVDTGVDATYPCPASLQPEGPCPVENQSCSDHGCTIGQESELDCYCSNKKWMCAALLCPTDAGADVDPITDFVNKMNGVWLIGVIGNMNHFSWVRIKSHSPGDWYGSAEFLSGDDLSMNIPYWPCSGTGSWEIPQKPDSIVFTLPKSCPSTVETEYTFEFNTGSGYPKGAIRSAKVSPLSGGQAIEGYEFPDSQCNAQMTSCIDPLK